MPKISWCGFLTLRPAADESWNMHSISGPSPWWTSWWNRVMLRIVRRHRSDCQSSWRKRMSLGVHVPVCSQDSAGYAHFNPLQGESIDCAYTGQAYSIIGPTYVILAVQLGVARAFALRSTLSLRSCGSRSAQLCRFAPAGCAQLCRFAPVLRSCAQLCRFAVVRSASSPPDRSLHPQKTPLRNFVLRWTSAGLKTYIVRFRMVRHKHKRSAPGYFLSWRQPSVSPVQIFLLAVRRRASSPYSLCHSFNPCRWPAASLCWWPSVQTSFIVTLARNRVNDREREHARKRQEYFLAWASWQLQRTCSYAGCLTNDRYARTVGFWNFLADRSSKYRQTDPRKSAKKLSDFWKSLHVQSRVVIQWDFWEAGFGFLCGGTWCTLARNRVNDRDREHGRKGKDLFWLERAVSFGSLERACSSYLQRMCVPWETLDTWTFGFRNLLYPTDPRNNDRLTHARNLKVCERTVRF